MAITSVGYEGPVTDAQWPVLAWSLVGGYSVAGAGDFKVAKTGDLTISVQNGVAVGAGVMDTGVTITAPSIPTSSGARWDLIALRRNWSTDTSSVVRVEGTASRVIPSGREVTKGTLDDQPLALVRVQAGAIQEVVDLRVWVSDGGAYAVDDLVLSYMNRLGVQIRVGEDLWSRELDALGSPVWVSVTKLTVSAPLVLLGSYVARSGSLVPQVSRTGGRVYADGTLDTSVTPTNWAAGASYQVAVVPVGFRPAAEVSGVVRFSNGFASVLIQPSGAVLISLASAATINAGFLILSLGGLSWPIAA